MLSALKVGFVGYGKMGSAILKGLQSHVQALYAYDIYKEQVPAGIYKEFDDLIQTCDIIILATKPQTITKNIEDALSYSNTDKVFVSIAAGIELDTMRESAQQKAPCVRCMPNLPASVGKGVFALCFNDPLLSEIQRDNVHELFKALGAVYILNEDEFDAFTGLAGCGPGFVFHLMEGFYQAAVTLGFSHQDSRELTVQTFLGSVELAAAEKHSFYDLKQMVSSPKGVTIQGVNHLEASAVKASILEAIMIAAKHKVK